jgi:hypothetical protein
MNESSQRTIVITLRGLIQQLIIQRLLNQQIVRLPSTHDLFFVDHDRVLHHPEIIRESLL